MRFNMNRKLIFGLASAGFASLFWACGSGDILEIQQDDRFLLITLNDDPNMVDGYVQRGVTAYCNAEAGANSEQCIKELQPGHINNNTASSSSATNQNNPAQTRSSSGTFNPFGNNNQQQNPTSAENVNIVSSPSQQQNPTSSPNIQPASHATVTSSSAVVADPNAWGTCAANSTTNSIKKGASIQWKVALDNTKVTASMLSSMTYAWTFQDGTPATATVQKSATSPSVSYSTSGIKSASVTLTNGGQTNTIQCTPLNVTGAEVSGCTCTPSATQVDVAVSGDVTWTVSGCKSTDQTFSYEWSDGLIGQASAGGRLSTKGTYAPTVTVKNSDNGMQTVTCGAVTAIDGNHPDYIIKTAGQQGEIDLPAGNVTVVLEVDAYNGKVICNANGPISGTVNTSTVLNGNYYVSVAMSGLKKGAQLVFNLSSPAKCGVE